MRLMARRDGLDLLLLGLARGGVAVAFEVAVALHARLDVLVVRKLGVPGRKELAMGAIAPGNVVVKNPSVLAASDISDEMFQAAVDGQRAVLAQNEAAYRGPRPAMIIQNRLVVLIDDGLATGASMQAAVEAVRVQEAARVEVAVPVAAREACRKLRPLVDDLICLETPEPFFGVGQWYDDFRQISDEEVRQLLEPAEQRLMAGSPD